MIESAFAAIGYGLIAYCAIGALVALRVVSGGLARLDPQAAAAPLRVKLLWAPGLIGLWPIVALRLAGRSPPEDRG